MTAAARPTLTLVVAVAENGVIGAKGGLPWHLSSDLKRFKADTIGKPVVMGRKTFLSIGKPLPGRDNIVITRDNDFKADGIFVAKSVEEALRIAAAAAAARGASDIAVIGGGEIYNQLIEQADRIFLTHVFASPDGDTWFPKVNPRDWRVTASEDFPAAEKDSHATRRVVFARRNDR